MASTMILESTPFATLQLAVKMRINDTTDALLLLINVDCKLDTDRVTLPLAIHTDPLFGGSRLHCWLGGAWIFSGPPAVFVARGGVSRMHLGRLAYDDEVLCYNSGKFISGPSTGDAANCPCLRLICPRRTLQLLRLLLQYDFQYDFYYYYYCGC